MYKNQSIINNRKEYGHFETDTVMSKNKHQCILALFERKSGMHRIAKLLNRTAKNDSKAMIEIIAQEPRLFKTIALNNGTDLLSYKALEAIFGLRCYFANPHDPWDRVCNENFNGLLQVVLPQRCVTELHW